jgi:hypothetical protein
MANYAGNNYAVKIDYRATSADKFKSANGVVVAANISDAATVAYENLCGRTATGNPPTYAWGGTPAAFKDAVSATIPAQPGTTTEYSSNIQVYSIRRVETIEDAAAVMDY